jgi:hypothetical protein
MYAPYPFANQKFAELQPDNRDDPLALPEGMSMRYACEPASVVGGDSFTLVSATPHGPGWTITTSTRTESGPPREVAYELP